jgi:ubiquinol-cytochrome c reductase cytochrome c subunit
MAMVGPPASGDQHDRPGNGRRRPRPSGGRATWQALGGYAALVAIAAFATLLLPALSAGSTPATPPAGTVVDDTAAGLNLYTQSCAACHGPGAVGTANGPNIQNAGAALVDFVLRTGRMPLAAPDLQMHRGVPQFDEADTEALVAYLASLGSGPAIPDVVTQGSSVADGNKLYVANCAACHGMAGGGGAVGGGFVAPGLGEADAKSVGEAVLTGPGQMPRFSFTPEQVDALAAYVQYLHGLPHPGGATAPVVGPVTEGFIAGLALIVLLLVARWIGVRQKRQS